MALELTDQVERFKDFIDTYYKSDLFDLINAGKTTLVIDFSKLAEIDPELSGLLLDEPEETLKAAEVSIEQMDVPVKCRVRFFNLPKSQDIRVKDIRSNDLGKFVVIEGLIRQASDVRPQAVSATFECPSCGNSIKISQIEQKFKEPSRCSCGRRGHFRLLNKELVDIQRLVVEETPESLVGGEQAKRISVFLREDMVEPRMERKTTPGSKVRAIGIIKEIPIPANSGGHLTRYDIVMECNFVEPIEETFEEIKLSQEDVEEITKLTQDPAIYEKLISSITPTVMGHEDIKEAIMLQLAGGVRKVRNDGTTVRGDLHILCVGDPGASKCVCSNTKIVLGNGLIKRAKDLVDSNLTNPIKIDDGVYNPVNFQLPSLGLNAKSYFGVVNNVWKREAPKLMYKIITRTGNETVVTPTHPMFVTDNGSIRSKVSEKLKVGEFIAAPRILKVNTELQKIDFEIEKSKSCNANHITVPNVITSELARFLGYMISDSYIVYSKTSGNVKFTNSNDVLLNDCLDLAKKIFNVRGKIKQRKKTTKDVLINSIELVRFLEKIDLTLIQRAKFKHIPDLIQKSPDYILKEFIKSLYDGEGTVTKDKRAILISSASPELIFDLKTLLLRFGIISQVGSTMACATNTVRKIKRQYWILTISGKEIKKYNRHIGFTSLDKQNKLINSINLDKIYNTNIDVVPNVSGLLKKIRKSLKLTQFEMGTPRTTYQHFERGDRNPSRRSLKLILDAVQRRFLKLLFVMESNSINLKELREDLYLSQESLSSLVGCSSSLISQYELGRVRPIKNAQIYASIQKLINGIVTNVELKSSILRLEALATSDILWDRIESIEIVESDEDYVYDLTVDRVHNFVANNLFVHNSTLLTFVAKAAPKARYVAGRGASAAGITASVVKDEFLKGWALEAGAIVLANGGYLCLDEMDKMSVEDTSALHEAMAQQQVTISKANIHACYSSDTEVLTESGWKKYDLVKNEQIVQYDPKINTFKFLPHNGLYVYNYNDYMYHFKNKRNDILVTPNHKMLSASYSGAKFKESEAQKIKTNRIHFLNSANFISDEELKHFILPPIKHKQNRKHPKYIHQSNPKKIPIDLWLEFLGYYLSEGGLQGSPTFGIPQKDKTKTAKIRNCLKNLSNYVGFTLTESKDGEYTRFQITNTQLFTYLQQNCGVDCTTKKCPLNLSNFSKKQLKILYDAMMLGDGASDGRSLSSTSKELIDFFQALSCLVGKSASNSLHYEKGYRKNRNTCYRVILSDRIKPMIKLNQVRKIKYKGKVFCFSTSTGFFVTRRNGKITIQGNTLSAKTAVLAAANPKLGRFDPYQPIASQINLPPALINRFDLIFPVRDIPDEKKDRDIASHVLNLHQNVDSIKPAIEVVVLKKFYSYIRQHCNPKLTDGAMEEISNFYVDLRNKVTTSGDSAVKPIPISARQLEALIRLSEASARIRLSDKVVRKDAQRAIRILKYCLMQVGFDYETGQIDIDRITGGVPASQRGKIIIVRDLLTKFEKDGKKIVSMDELMAAAYEKGVEEDKVEEALNKMKREGEIFEPRRGFISKV